MSNPATCLSSSVSPIIFKTPVPEYVHDTLQPHMYISRGQKVLSAHVQNEAHRNAIMLCFLMKGGHDCSHGVCDIGFNISTFLKFIFLIVVLPVTCDNKNCHYLVPA